MKKKSYAGRSAAFTHLIKASFLLMALVASFLNVSQTYAQGPKGKVGICHRTGSATNPYVFIVVDENAVPAHTGHGDIIGVSSDADCPKALPAAAQPQGKVGICHRTDSATNPYVYIVVDDNAVPAHREHGDMIGVSSQADCPATVSNQSGATGASESSTAGIAAGASGIGGAAAGANVPDGLPVTGAAPVVPDAVLPLGLACGGLALLVVSKIVSRRSA